MGGEYKDGSSESGCKCINCIDLAQDRNWWQALVNAVRNLRFPFIAGYFLCS